MVISDQLVRVTALSTTVPFVTWNLSHERLSWGVRFKLRSLWKVDSLMATRTRFSNLNGLIYEHSHACRCCVVVCVLDPSCASPTCGQSLDHYHTQTSLLRYPTISLGWLRAGQSVANLVCSVLSRAAKSQILFFDVAGDWTTKVPTSQAKADPLHYVATVFCLRNISDIHNGSLYWARVIQMGLFMSWTLCPRCSTLS